MLIRILHSFQKEASLSWQTDANYEMIIRILYSYAAKATQGFEAEEKHY